MRAAVLAIGSELLGTDRLDTNSLSLAAALERYGVELCRKAVVGDDEQEIGILLGELLAAADLVLVTGGLGPTADDVTRQAAAATLGRPLVEDPALIEDIRAKFQRFDMRMPEVNRRQALVIEGAEVLPNRRGTAPGLRLEVDGRCLFLFPGVPHELDGLIARSLEPWLAERAGGEPRHARTLKVACVPESTVEERLAPAYAEFGRAGIAVLASPGEIRVRLSAARAGELETMAARVGELFGDAVFGRRPEITLEEVVGGLLADAGATVGTAESCTGGLVAERLTRVAGSSAWFVGGVVAYADRLKTTALGVPEDLVARHGAVSRPVAEAMASGARRVLGADWALAITGIAGPGGGSEAKPVGTVHFALAGPQGVGVVHRRLRLPGDRTRVRQLSSQWALDMLRRRLIGAAVPADRG